MEPRPFAFHKMEALVKQMQDPETGVPVRSQKIFLTSIPSAFMGYDLIGWLMEHLNIEESGEAVHLANQLCQYGYLFPVTDCKSLTVKDDNSLYRFQAAYYWPWHHRNPDNVEYAIYLVKRSQRNKQRHALDDYELEALASLKKNLQNKWELITMQAEEQIKVGKERKKMEKLVADSQERAYWRVHRPPPGSLPPLDPGPFSTLRKTTQPPPHNSQIEILRRQVSKSRVKASQAIDSLVNYCNTYCEYDTFLTPAQPSNPWLSDDPSYWQFNQPIVEIPTEKRVKRWGLSFEDLLADPSGVEEFTNYLRKEYSHENIRFWLAVKDLRRCSQSQVPNKVKSIYEEFLVHGAPCEINIDSKTLESTLNEMKTPSRFVFDVAAHHVYNVLLNKDCYPRFIRSDHYKNLLATALHPPTKKRFFGFVGGGKKKSCGGVVGVSGVGVGVGTGSSVAGARRRGSDRSLTGLGHDTLPTAFPHHPPVPLSSSQANLHDISSSRESGISPERIAVPPSETKQVSFERKHSSEEDKAAIVEGTTESTTEQKSEQQETIVPQISQQMSELQLSENNSNAQLKLSNEEIEPENESQTELSADFDSSEKSKIVEEGVEIENSSEFLSLESCHEKTGALQLVGKEESQRSESNQGSQVSLSGSLLGSPMKIPSLSDSGNKFTETEIPERSFDRNILDPMRKFSVCSLKDPVESKPAQLEIKSEESLVRVEYPAENKRSQTKVIEVKANSAKASAETLSTEVVPPIVVNVEEIRPVLKEEKRLRKSERKARVMSEEHRSDRRKESSVERRHLSMDDDDYTNSPKKASVQSLPLVTDKVNNAATHNATEVCPWEDEESCKTEETFVKKYATLGYL